MILNLFILHIKVIIGFLIRDIVYQNSALCLLEITIRHRMVLLLAGSVPELDVYNIFLYFYLLSLEVYSNGTHLIFVEYILYVP